MFGVRVSCLRIPRIPFPFHPRSGIMRPPPSPIHTLPNSYQSPRRRLHCYYGPSRPKNMASGKTAFKKKIPSGMYLPSRTRRLQDVRLWLMVVVLPGDVDRSALRGRSKDCLIPRGKFQTGIFHLQFAAEIGVVFLARSTALTNSFRKIKTDPRIIAVNFGNMAASI